MRPVGNDIYTTHINRWFAKKLKINMGIGLVATLLCGYALLFPFNPDPLIISCLVIGVAVVVGPALVLRGAQRPLRLTDDGIVARYGPMRELVVPWPDVVGIGIHPRRKRSCLICRMGSSPEPQLLVVPWMMIEESEQEVVAATEHQLALRGHRLEEDKLVKEAAGESGPANLLKDFWS